MKAHANLTQENGPRDPWTVWCERPAAPDDVCRALANGSTLKQWARSYNFDYFEVAHWLLDNPTRACNYERSLQIYAHYLRDEIIEIADDSSQDLLTDAKGKTTFNHAHFRRQGRQIETRKAIIRQITAGQRSAQSKSGKNAQPSLHMQYLKLSEAALSRKTEGAQASPTAPNPNQSAITPALLPPNLNPTPTLNPSAVSPSSIRVDPCNPCLSSQSATTSPEEPGRLARFLSAFHSVLTSFTQGKASPPPTPFPQPHEVGIEDRETAGRRNVVGRDSVEPHLLAEPARPEGASREEGRNEKIPSAWSGIKIPPDALKALRRGLKEYDQAKAAGAAVATSQSAIDGLVTDLPAQAGSGSETPGFVTDHASRSGEGRDEGAFQSAIRNPQSASEPSGSAPTFPSYKAYLRAIRESNWLEGQPLPFVYRPTPDAPRPQAGQDVVGMASTPSPTGGAASASAASISEATDGLLTHVPAQTGPGSGTSCPVTNQASRTTSTVPQLPATKQPPAATIGANVPKIDWYDLLGVRKIGMFLALLLFFVAATAANLHASIHSLSVPARDHRDRLSFDLPVTMFDPRCQTWSPPRPEFNLPRTTNNEQRTNPAQHSHRSRDAPPS